MSLSRKRKTLFIDILSDARDLLEDKNRWTRGEIARDSRGKSVSFFSPSACRWCALGAIRKISLVYANGDLTKAMENSELLCRWIRVNVEVDSLDSINDTKGRKAVLSVFEESRIRLRNTSLR